MRQRSLRGSAAVKVLMVVPHFFPRVGGVESYALNVALELQALGWQVVVVTTGASRGTSELRGMVVHRLRTGLTLSNTPVGLGWRRQLKRLIEAENPDLINAHTPVPYLADVAERTRGAVPYVLTYHNDLVKDFPPLNALMRMINLTVVGRTLRRCTAVIATSEHYLQESFYLKPYRPKINVVHPGIDCRRFNPDIAVGEDLAQLYAGRRVVLFVGSLNKSQQYKGLRVLIDSFSSIRKHYPDTILVVAGAGDGMNMYKSIASAAGLANAVVFTGHLEDAELAQYYKIATVFAMPSTSRNEGFGIAFIEASAVGVPVIGGNVGGVPYAVQDGVTGLLVEPNSAEALCEALRRILDDAALAKRLGQNGAARAGREFGWDVAGARTDEIFSDIAKASADH
jgi:glycosyltransferase involved in cell wall biosynthesis